MEMRRYMASPARGSRNACAGSAYSVEGTRDEGTLLPDWQRRCAGGTRQSLKTAAGDHPPQRPTLLLRWLANFGPTQLGWQTRLSANRRRQSLGVPTDPRCASDNPVATA